MAVGLTAVPGMGALATEAGACAGVSTLVLRGPKAPIALSVDGVARDAVTRTGFTNGEGGTVVTVQTGFRNDSSRSAVAPAPSGNAPNAVRVEVTQPQPMALARLISAAAPVPGVARRPSPPRAGRPAP